MSTEEPKSPILKAVRSLQANLPERRLSLVPADSLYSRSVEIPDALPETEWDDFFTLELETHSPFPIEQLAWGALIDSSRKRAFLYATTRGRLKQRIQMDPEEPFYCLPHFVPLSEVTPDKNLLRTVVYEDSLAVLELTEGETVPRRMLARHLSDRTPETLQREQVRLVQRLASNFPVEEGMWKISEAIVHSDDSVEFPFSHEADSPQNYSARLSLPEKAIWLADLRDAAFAIKEAGLRKRSRRIWKSLVFASYAAVALLLIQISLGILVLLNNLSEKKIAELEPRVSRVENTLTLAQRLAQSTNEDIKPFHLLEAINPLRPDSLYFREARAIAFNELEIEGVSESGVIPVNEYADTLTQQPFIANVENNSQTRNRQTTFNFIVRFSSLPEIPPEHFNLTEVADPEIPDEPESPATGT